MPDDAYRVVVAPREQEPPARIHNRPGPGHWDPVVVDRAAVPFEARPGVPGRYRPDTICDGWSTSHFVVRMASTRGDAHRQGGLQRQDHAVLADHPGTGAVLIAVMDGVSAADFSHIGAEEAGHGAVRAMWRMLDRTGTVDWLEVIRAAADALLRHPQFGLGQDETAGDVERRLATTIVTGLVRPTPDGPLATLVRVGDSGAWLLRAGRYTPLFGGKSAGEATLSSLVDPLPRVPDQVHTVEVPLSGDTVLLLATDGISDPLGDGTGLVGELLAEALASPPPILGLAHAVDFSRATFDDDRTLLAVWPKRPGPGRHR